MSDTPTQNFLDALCGLSPLPWRAGEGEAADCIYDAEGTEVATVITPSYIAADDFALAQLIVRAVNAAGGFEPVPEVPASKSADASETIPDGSLWRHYKGGLYRAIGTTVAIQGPVVVYRPENDARRWVRPLSEWSEEVSPGRKRFDRVYEGPERADG